MWVKRVAVVIIPVHPGTFTTPTRFTQHAPTFSPRTQFAWSHGTTLAGCHQTPNASTTEATWARNSACREPWHPMTTTQHPWADGWELSAKCAGVYYDTFIGFTQIHTECLMPHCLFQVTTMGDTQGDASIFSLTPACSSH